MRTLVVVAAIVLGASIVHAQEDFGPIALKPGQQVRVQEDGLTLRGQVVSVAPEALVVGSRRLQPGPGLKIERDRGRTGWKGIGIGAGLGAISGGVMLLPAALWGGFIGASMDQFVVVYDSRAWTLSAPQLSMPLFPPAGGDDFSGVAREGDRVVVTEDGVSIAGRVKSLSASRLAVGSYVFAPSPQLTIEKDGDPISDGAALGFLFGVVAPHLVEEGCWNTSDLRCSLTSGLEFALVGAVIDALHKGHTTVYADGHRRAVFFRFRR
ncbi:MAG TPA: hypothetical protein VFB07_13265 [Vicinamibacterales bacterium]|nr:hypothetical protein [Vicinamibacterales bacterium]